MEPIETIERDGYRIEIHYDDDPQNPRREYDHVGTMICGHNRYELGDEQLTRDNWVEQVASNENLTLVCEYCSQELECNYGEWVGIVDYDEPLIPCVNHDGHRPDLADIFYMPLYLYDHSGITMSVGPFSCPWDSGQVGIIYTTRAKAAETFMMDPADERLAAHAEKCMIAEVKEYDAYLTGQVFGYVIFPTGEDDNLDESCWGFIDEKECLDEANSVVDYLVQTTQLALESSNG